MRLVPLRFKLILGHLTRVLNEEQVIFFEIAACVTRLGAFRDQVMDIFDEAGLLAEARH